MKMYLKTALLAALLAFAPATAYSAVVASSETDDVFDAAEEVSLAIFAPARTTLSFFVSGTYSVANTVVVQRERGSPGSGAWEDVLTLDTSTANARTTETILTGPNPANYRMRMTVAGTGNVVAYMTDHPVAARAWVTNADQIVFYDEFMYTDEETSLTTLDVEKYLSLEEGGGTVALLVDANREGIVSILGDNDAGDVTCFSLVTAANQAALISDGWTVIEVRLAPSSIAAGAAIGFSDVICAGTGAVPFALTGTAVVADDNPHAEMAMIMFDDNATPADGWIAVSMTDTNAEGNDAIVVDLGSTVVVTVYADVLRIEIDSAGNAYYYVDGTLVHAEWDAMSTTAEIIPTIYAIGSGVNITLSLDYLMFVKPRPSTPSS